MKELFLACIFSSFLCFGAELQAKKSHSLKTEKTEDKSNSKISASVLQSVKPYLLPKKHFLKSIMDKICLQNRILSSNKALKKAGFHIICKKPNNGVIVASHPKLRGYLIKVFLDSNPREDWPLWILRVKNARFIKEMVEKHSYNKYFKVPEKWIYIVPEKGRPKENKKKHPKDFILIVKDMDLCSNEKTASMFKDKMNLSFQKALYAMITKAGLSDSHIKNIPFSRDGKIAFVDTKYVRTWPVHPEWCTPHFSKKNQRHWKKLIKNKD